MPGSTVVGGTSSQDLSSGGAKSGEGVDDGSRFGVDKDVK